jgi:ceramide glucosyltransferase
MVILTVVLFLLVLSGFVYTLFGLWAVCRFFSPKRHSDRQIPLERFPVSILKPVRGLDPSCADNMLSFCIQDYPHYEVLFGFREGNDPAIPVVTDTIARGLCDGRVVIDSRGSGANQKVLNIESLVAEAQYPLVAISDSDMVVDKDYLRRIVGEFVGGKKTGVVTCLYKISNPEDLGSALESLTIALDFIPSVLVARRLEGVTFGLGASMLVAKDALHQIGGFRPIGEYLADDYQLGFRLWKKGYQNILSRYVIENRVGPMTLRDHFAHQMRWARTYRASRPKGFAGYGITHMFPFALLLACVYPGPWTAGIIAVVLALRCVLAFAVSRYVVRTGGWLRWLFLLPVKDLTGFITWAWSFLGSTVYWRGNRYRIVRDGKMVKA